MSKEELNMNTDLMAQAEALRQAAAVVVGEQDERDAARRAAAEAARRQGEEAEAQRLLAEREQAHRLAQARLGAATADVLADLAAAERLAEELVATAGRVCAGLDGILARCATDALPYPRAVSPGELERFVARLQARLQGLAFAPFAFNERAMPHL